MYNPKLEVLDKMYRCFNEGCLKVYPRDPGSAKNNTVERAKYEKELEEAERAAAEAAERGRAVLARAERALRRAEEAEAEGRRRSLRQRIR